MRKLRSLSITPGQRFETGCIAAFNDGTSRHFAGEGSDAIQAVADISTPVTIYRDLQGWRRPDDPTQRKRVASLEKIDDVLRLPEWTMLNSIGRRDLLA